MPTKEKRKLAAIMFIDVVGYSRMMASNEERTLELLKDFEDICSPIISDNEGVIIKKVGDELFCEFSSAKEAVDSALAIQVAIQPYNDSRPKDFKLQVRIGIHIGDIVLRDGDVFGDGVNVASRIQPFANPGGICISSAVKDSLTSHPNYNIISEGQQELKNILEKHSLYKVETGFEIIDEKQNGFKINSWVYRTVYLFIILFVILVITKTSIPLGKWGALGFTQTKEDLIRDNYVVHFSSTEKLMEDFLQTDFANQGPTVSSYKSINKTFLELIRKNVIPKIHPLVVLRDIYPHYPENEEEYKLMEKLSLFDSYYHNNENLRDSIPEVAKRYETKLKEVNEVFDYFSNKYKKHIDEYVLVYMSDIDFGKDGRRFIVFDTYYRDVNRKKINYGFMGNCNNCDLKWNEDSLQNIYDEIVLNVSDFLIDERYSDKGVGDVIEIIDTNLISIEITNNKIIKGMELYGHRIWRFGDGEITLQQYILDKETIINYYNDHPGELEKLRHKKDWRPTHWYSSAKSIDELLSLFEDEVDSLKENYKQVLTDWEDRGYVSWDSIMKYKFKIIKVSGNEAIGKIIWKKAPYVTPQKGDMIEFEE